MLLVELLPAVELTLPVEVLLIDDVLATAVDVDANEVPLELVVPIELGPAADGEVLPVEVEVAPLIPPLDPIVAAVLDAAPMLDVNPEDAAVEDVAIAVIPLLAAAPKHPADSSQIAMLGQPSGRNETVQQPVHEAQGLVIAQELPEVPVLDVAAEAVALDAGVAVEALADRVPLGGRKHAGAHTSSTRLSPTLLMGPTRNSFIARD